MTRKNLGFAGSALLVAGLFTPIVTMPIVGSINLFNNGSNVVALMVVVLAAMSAGLVATDRFRDLVWPGAAAGGILLYLFGRLQYGLSEMRESLSRDLAGNPFAGMAQTLVGSVQLQWGWLVLALGAGMIIYVGVSERKADSLREPVDSDAPEQTRIDGPGRGVAAISVLLLLAAPAWDFYARTSVELPRPSDGANSATAPVGLPGPTTGAQGPSREEAAYIAQNLRVYDMDARYYDSVLDGRVPGVRFKIKNNGNRTLNRVTVRVVFFDANNNAIAEEEYNPVLVSSYSVGDDNTPLRPNYIWQQDPSRFMVANNVPSEWQTGRAQATITDIEFGPNE